MQGCFILMIQDKEALFIKASESGSIIVDQELAICDKVLLNFSIRNQSSGSSLMMKQSRSIMCMPKKQMARLKKEAVFPLS